jgi:SAM-dependent methyltransferase
MVHNPCVPRPLSIGRNVDPQGVPDELDPSPRRLAAARAARRRGRRFGWLLGDTIFDRIRVDTGLRFLHSVLGLEQLSYGLWEDDELTLDGLRTAQSRYADLLVDLIPSDVRRVLDVGCGSGSTAMRMIERGLDVEGLAPDPYLGEVFPQRTRRPFHLCRFELFRPTEPFDLILMSESAQYVMLDQLFRRVMLHNPGAYLLVADYFRITPRGALFGPSGHLLDEFLDEAEQWQFGLLHREDITDRVAPTLALARTLGERFVVPTVKVVDDAMVSRRPLLWKIGGPVFRRLARPWQERIRRLDASRFVRDYRYEVFLFRAPDSLDELWRRKRARP